MLRKLIFTIPFYLLVFGTAYGQPNSLGKVVLNAEEMPHWNSCAQEEKKEDCTKSELEQYIKRHIKYPREALAQDIEGVVIVSCIISNTGKVVKPNVISDIGGGCGAEALRIVSNMPIWLPAKDDGDVVSVVYNIEVPFVLDEVNEEARNDEIVYEEPIKPLVSRNDSFPSKVMDESINEEKQLLPSDYEETNNGRVYTRVSHMPYFPGCDNLKDKSKEKRECSNQRLIEYVSSYLTYPDEAKSKSIEGIVYVSFIIDEEGNVIDPTVERDIGGGCGAEALRVVSTMAQWESGREKGKAVKTKMNLPVRFFLSAGASGKYRIHWGALRSNQITEAQVINSLTEDLVVRNIFGDDITISTLNVTYEKGKNIKEANSNGDITFEIMRLLRKVKSGGKLIFTATVQEKGELLDVYRVFKVVK